MECVEKLMTTKMLRISGIAYIHSIHTKGLMFK